MSVAEKDINQAFVSLSKAYAGNLGDPYPLYKKLRDQSPIYDGDLVADFGVPSLAAGRDGKRKVFCLLGNEVVTKALMDPELYSTEVWREAFGGVLGDPVLLYMKGPEHKFSRNMLAQILSPAAIKDMVDKHFKPTIEGMVKSFVANGKAELMSAFILDFPIRVIYELFGLPSKDPAAYEQFSTRALIMVLGGLIDPRKPEEAQERIANAFQANKQIYDQIIEIVQTRRASGDFSGYDMISQLLRYEHEGKTLDDDAITQFLLPNLAAAGETTSRGFANVLALLLERPALLEQVRNDRSLVKTAINETMRFEGSVSVLPRIVTRDLEIDGVKVPAGSGVNILVGAANRDPAAHENPEEFSLQKRTKQALSFGFGPHMCMGMPLAKVEMEIALNTILDLLPNIRFDPAGNYEGIKGIQFRSPPTLNVEWDV
ncbi:MAG: hypothetical protein JWM78_2340 [Verrucomicrobiaceae bacterium]|nr:hypothetical protein [Verrucomicrobiaceae bacterium]